MRFTSLVSAASALIALAVVAAPVETSLDKAPGPDLATVYFSLGTPQELVEKAAIAAAEQGGQVEEFFGLPPNGHDMGFKAYLTKGSADAIMQAVGKKAAVTFQNGREIVGGFCPEAICHS